jgi:hypothetical protein
MSEVQSQVFNGAAATLQPEPKIDYAALAAEQLQAVLRAKASTYSLFLIMLMPLAAFGICVFQGTDAVGAMFVFFACVVAIGLIGRIMHKLFTLVLYTSASMGSIARISLLLAISIGLMCLTGPRWEFAISATVVWLISSQLMGGPAQATATATTIVEEEES